MEAFRHHIYICDQKKPEGVPSCTANGSLEVIEALRGDVRLARAVRPRSEHGRVS